MAHVINRDCKKFVARMSQKWERKYRKNKPWLDEEDNKLFEQLDKIEKSSELYDIRRQVTLNRAKRLELKVLVRQEPYLTNK